MYIYICLCICICIRICICTLHIFIFRLGKNYSCDVSTLKPKTFGFKNFQTKYFGQLSDCFIAIWDKANIASEKVKLVITTKTREEKMQR